MTGRPMGAPQAMTHETGRGPRARRSGDVYGKTNEIGTGPKVFGRGLGEAFLQKGSPSGFDADRRAAAVHIEALLKTSLKKGVSKPFPKWFGLPSLHDGLRYLVLLHADFIVPNSGKLLLCVPVGRSKGVSEMNRHEGQEGASGSGVDGSTSRTLLAKLRTNDPEAWQRLVVLYAPLVYYWCRRRHVLEQEIGDVFQEVFQSVASHIADFRKQHPSDTFRGWLRTITHNKAIDHARRLSKQPRAVGGTEAHRNLASLPDLPPPDPPDDDLDAKQADDELFHRALDSIRSHFAERTWQAFWRVVVDGQAPKDVADELGMRPGAVRVAKSRVLHRLRAELGDLL